MSKFFSANSSTKALDLWLLIFRICIGCFMLTHGLPKLQNLIAGNYTFADPIGIGQGPSLALMVFAEAVCSVLLILGLATRFATLPLIIGMLVAAFSAHAADPFGKKELSLLYLLIYLTLLVTGPGKYSIDAIITGRKSKR